MVLFCILVFSFSFQETLMLSCISYLLLIEERCFKLLKKSDVSESQNEEGNKAQWSFC